MTSQRLSRILLAFTLVIASFALPTAKTQNQSDSVGLTEKLAAIEKAIEEKRNEFGVPGVAVAVVKDDKVVFQKGFGLRDVERNLPVTPDTLFAIGSCGKAFTAMAAVISQDEGKLSLDDSPKKHLPYFKLQDPEADAKITVRDLLHHSSGLDRTDISWYTGALNREEAIRVAGLAKPTAKFREKFQYQNTMYSAAGEIVARANQTTWEDYIAERFFKPLGMKSSDTSIKQMVKAADFATGYSLAEKKATKAMLRDLTNIAPAGSINSNVKDMPQWVRLMLGGGVFEGKRFVSEKGFAEIVKKHISMGGAGYGLGWMLSEWNGRQVVSHEGGIDGFNSLVALMPDQKLGLVVLTNVSSSALPRRISDVVFDNIVSKPQGNFTGPKMIDGETGAEKGLATASLPQYKELIGKYELNGESGEITTKDDKVVLSVPGQAAYTLVEKAKDAFGVRELPDTYRLTVKRNAAGEIIGFLLKQPDGEFDVKRVLEPPADASAKFEVTIDELMAKTIAAAGGEANLRKHHSMMMTSALDFENQGLTGELVARAQAPNLTASVVTVTGLGKKIATMREYFDGSGGGAELSFALPETLKDKRLEDARVAADFYELLNWKTLFKTVTIKEKSKVDDEEVYVVVKTPEKGNPITDYISTKSFLTLKRDRTVGVGAGQGAIRIGETYSDYRNVDGVMIPFKSVSQHPTMGRIVSTVKEVKFNVDVPATTFRASAK
jgi:CubicO group peptidase (beta-lactamase class C family)